MSARCPKCNSHNIYFMQVLIEKYEIDRMEQYYKRQLVYPAVLLESIDDHSYLQCFACHERFDASKVKEDDN